MPPEIAVFEIHCRRASVRTHEIDGCGKVLVPTLRNSDIVFMDDIVQPGGLQEACS
jgi:hypothetical protein